MLTRLSPHLRHRVSRGPKNRLPAVEEKFPQGLVQPAQKDEKLLKVFDLCIGK